MTDTWQGEGWWIATDGKWYPPESHPDAVAPPPEPSPVGAVPTAPASRWLGRSPQPPATATATLEDTPGRPATTPTSARWSNLRGATAPVTPAAVTPAPSALLGPPVRPRPPQRPVAIWVFISIGAVVVTVVIALLVTSGGRGVIPGPENGTITVAYATSGRPSFSGTIDGTALTGKLTDSSVTAGSDSNGRQASTTRSFVYRGRYAGNAYVLHVSPSTPAPTIGQQGEWQVTGTDGSNPVNGEVNYDGETENNQIPFSGSIGSEHLLGSAVVTEQSGRALEMTVSFVNLP